MTDDQIKRSLIRLLGESIDEAQLPDDVRTFVEMDEGVIHVVVDQRSRYFQVTLTETTESEYFKPYEP